jgi:hypothetical protein
MAGGPPMPSVSNFKRRCDTTSPCSLYLLAARRRLSTVHSPHRWARWPIFRGRGCETRIGKATSTLSFTKSNAGVRGPGDARTRRAASAGDARPTGTAPPRHEEEPLRGRRLTAGSQAKAKAPPAARPASWRRSDAWNAVATTAIDDSVQRGSHHRGLRRPAPVARIRMTLPGPFTRAHVCLAAEWSPANVFACPTVCLFAVAGEARDQGSSLAVQPYRATRSGMAANSAS